MKQSPNLKFKTLSFNFLFTITVFFVSQTNLISQEPFCLGVVDDSANLRDTDCSRQSATFITDYRKMEKYLPIDVNTPIKTVHVNIIVWQKADGTGSFQNQPSDIQNIQETIDRVNSNFIINEQRLYSQNLPYNITELNDSRIRVVLDNIYFIPDVTPTLIYYYGWSTILYDTYMTLNYPEATKALNIHCSGYQFAPGVGGFSNGVSGNGTIVTKNTGQQGWYWWGEHLAHEIGHSLGLAHTYNQSGAYFGDQNCNLSHDFLYDIYDITQSCPNSSCDHCLIDGGPTNNNLMGGGANTHTSALQMGIMHRVAAQENVRDKITGYSDIPYVVNQNEEWDFSMKFYQNILIKTGNTLTIKCQVQFVPNTKIIIEPGAKLIVDGGTLTHERYYSDMWLGIDVQGNKNLHQTDANQGVVELRNGAVIEYARNGIRTIGTDELDNKDWNKTGGIVRVYEATFKNCWRGVEFLSYKNMNPTGNGQEMPNISFINNADFITSEALPNNLIPYCGISMFEVKGIKVIKCNFENTRSDVATIPYTERGNGIFSHDATYKVSPGYNISSGSPILGSQNTFKNLYFGMSTGGSSSLSSVTVKDNYFENCIFGVSLSGANYSIIGKNTINVGDRDPNTYSIGIHTRGAYGYNIEQNTISRHLGSTFQNQGVHTAINQPFASAKVYKNNITNTTFGNQTANGNSTTKVDCNQYTKGSLSTIDFHHASGTLGTQGSNIGTPAYNQFIGACNNSLLAQIYRNPSASIFSYYYSTQTNSLNPNCTNIGTFAIPNNLNPNFCLSTLPTEVLIEKPIKLSQVKTSLGEVKNEITTNNNLIDGGNTQNLINLINNPNSAAWQVDQTLQAASPYLSDAVLLAMINRSPKLPDWVVDNILQANSPLHSEVLLAVIAKTYPDWVLNTAITNSAPVSSTVLLTLIDSNYPAWLTNTVLKQHSPLFDNVLVAMINQTNLPDWANNEVLLLNTPLSQEVTDAMNNRIPSFPTWMVNQINNNTYQAPNPIEPTPVVSVTDEIQRTLQYLKRERLDLTDQVVRIYIDTLWIDSVVVFLEQEGTIEAIQALVPIEMDRDTTKAKQHIATIEAHADSLEQINAAAADIEELRNFTKFQELLLELKTKEGSYYSMSPQQRRMLQEWSIKDLAIALQAQAILDFVNEKLPVFDGEDAYFPKNMTEEESEQLINQESKNGYQFTVSPNPSNGFVAFTLESDNLENMEIVITDMQGKIIKILTVDNLRINYEFINLPYGIYLAHLTKNGVIQNTQKALYVK